MKRSALGIAAVCVAIALPCVQAPAQASASVLCSVQKNPCGAANIYPIGRVVEAAVPKGGTTEIVTTLATVTCLESQVGVKITNEGGKGASVIGRVTVFNFKQCTVPDGKGGTENCSVNPVNMGAGEAEQYLTSFTANAGSLGNGTMGIGASSIGLLGYSVSCAAPAKVDCTFEGAPNLTFTGGTVGKTPGTIAGSVSMTPKKGGAKCPATAATWNPKWQITSPSPLFLVVE